MLTADELTDIQATQSANLPDTCTIRRMVRSSDGGGGSTVSWANVATGVACRSTMTKQPVTLLNALRETVFADWIVTLPSGTVTVSEDEIVTSRGQTLTVIGLIAGPWATAVRVACTERQ